ncbi:MAG: ribosome maturation factor RimM [Alphaproteobacteria bacterium]|nr:ribosome maturation factor RimM [Alphaproteobacteria bacterium]
MTKSNTKICVGKFLGPHGVRGQVRLGSFTDDPESIFEYEPLTDETGAYEYVLTVHGVGKDHYIVSVDGCTTREVAEKLKGTKLYVDRDALPAEEEGEYYFADLIGLKAQETNGAAVGLVTDVHDYGAGAFLEIKPAHAKSFMLPFKDAFVPTVDVAGGFVEVVIPEGWLAEEKPPKEKKEDL